MTGLLSRIHLAERCRHIWDRHAKGGHFVSSRLLSALSRKRGNSRNKRCEADNFAITSVDMVQPWVIHGCPGVIDNFITTVLSLLQRPRTHLVVDSVELTISDQSQCSEGHHGGGLGSAQPCRYPPNMTSR